MSERTVVWAGWPHAPAPLAAIRDARRAGATTIVDDAGRVVELGALRWLWEAARNGWRRLLQLDLDWLAALICRRRSPIVRGHRTDNVGPVVVVLPVLPDLSHTFVYRELLAMLKQRPDWHVVVLARNELAPKHAEAEQLIARVNFLRRDGITRSYLRVLGWLMQRAGRQLVSLYRAQPDARSRELFGKMLLRDPRHPGNGFVLADQLRPLQPRHLHVYSSTWPANVAMGAAHLLGVPFSISSYVDFEFPYSHQLLLEKVARATFFRVVTAFCAERLRELPALAELARLAELGPLADERVPVVYLGLDLDNWQQVAERPGRGVMVSAARIVKKKGLHLMPPALVQLRAREIAFRWRVIGDGPELAALRTACEQHGINDAVEFLGARDNAQVRQALLHADVAVLPCIVAADGERDGIPIFLIEAMALGVPVVTTPISGIPELVRDGDTGLLCATDDVDALSNRLAEALGDDHVTEAIANRGRAEVHRTLDVTEAAAQMIALIER